MFHPRAPADCITALPFPFKHYLFYERLQECPKHDNIHDIHEVTLSHFTFLCNVKPEVAAKPELTVSSQRKVRNVSCLVAATNTSSQQRVSHGCALQQGICPITGSLSLNWKHGKRGFPIHR